MQLYLSTPISELPENEGYYYTEGQRMEAYYHADIKLFEFHSQLTHWLKPVDLSSLIEDHVKDLKQGNEYLSMLINDMLSDKPKDNWISVEEKTFDTDKVYQLCLDNGVTYVTGSYGYNNKHRTFAWKDVMGSLIQVRYKLHVTHWQPLLLPPKTKY